MAKTLQDADREARKLVANWTTGAALTGWIPGSAFFPDGGRYRHDPPGGERIRGKRL